MAFRLLTAFQRLSNPLPAGGEAFRAAATSNVVGGSVAPTTSGLDRLSAFPRLLVAHFRFLFVVFVERLPKEIEKPVRKTGER